MTVLVWIAEGHRPACVDTARALVPAEAETAGPPHTRAREPRPWFNTTGCTIVPLRRKVT
jgi:hypothetical protein